MRLQSSHPLRLELVLILSIRVSSSKRDLNIHNPNNITSLPHNDHVTRQARVKYVKYRSFFWQKVKSDNKELFLAIHEMIF